VQVHLQRANLRAGRYATCAYGGAAQCRQAGVNHNPVEMVTAERRGGIQRRRCNAAARRQRYAVRCANGIEIVEITQARGKSECGNVRSVAYRARSAAACAEAGEA